MDKKPKSGYG